MAAIFEKFAKSGYRILPRYPGGNNFDEITLYLTIKEIEAILCFYTYGQNRKFKMPAIFENFDKIALSTTVKEIEAILCFATFIWP